MNEICICDCAHLLGLVTQQGQAPLDGLARLPETRVQERFVLGNLQHRDLGLTHCLLLDVGRVLVFGDGRLQQ